MRQDQHFQVDQNWLQFLFSTVAMARSTPRRLPDVFVGDLFAADVVPVVVVCFNVVVLLILILMSFTKTPCFQLVWAQDGLRFLGVQLRHVKKVYITLY